MHATMRISITATGEDWNVRLVKVGDNFGLNDRAVNRDHPFVEIYDPAYDDTPLGYRISSYSIPTLASAARRGISIALEGSYPEYAFGTEAVHVALEWAVVNLL